MKNKVLTPKEVESRLGFVAPDFRQVLTRARKERCNIVYHYMETPFGMYPMAIELNPKAK